MKVTVVTQVFNGINYVPETIESVLNQTHRDLEYIIVDSGSTDGIEKIIDEYAAKDSRIKIKRYPDNKRQMRWVLPLLEMGTGDYFTVIDSDDLFDETFLERLTYIAETTSADIVTTGTKCHYDEPDADEGRVIRGSAIAMEIERKDFAEYFDEYVWLFRVHWGKLLRMDLAKKMPSVLINELGDKINMYNIDTIYCLDWLTNSEKIYLDNSVLHTYRIRNTSFSYGYDPKQSISDVYLYNSYIDYLNLFGPVNNKNMVMVCDLYIGALDDTTSKLINMSDSVKEIKEYRKIFERDITVTAIKETQDRESINIFFLRLLECGSRLPGENKDFTAIIKKYFPKCASAVTPQTAKLFVEDETLMNYLENDHRKFMVKYFVSLIENHKHSKQYNLPQMLLNLAYDKPIANEISDEKFIWKYGSIYLLIWNKKYNDALDKMTDILLKELVPNETFYKVYLSLAASLECADEFVFGKIKQAHYYCDNGNRASAAEILNDLADMGVEDNEEMAEVRVKI